MTKITFRSVLKNEDLASIEEITRSTGFFEAVEGEIECAVEDARDTLEHGSEKSGSEYVLAECDGNVVAFASFGPVALTEGSWFLYWIAVHQSCRGKGCGRSLMNHVLEGIFKRGARKAFLQTSARPQYEPTRAFYLGMGFTKEAVLKDYYKDGEDCAFFSITKEKFFA